jgi:hypothetical protein
MHPPLLKSVAGRRKNKRFKGCTEGNGSTSRKKGQQRCPICQRYGHHWHTCKGGDPADDPADIAAMQAERYNVELVLSFCTNALIYSYKLLD